MESVIKWQTGMPEQSGQYLVTLSTGEVTAMAYNNRFASSPYWFGEENEEGTVVAWCRLSDIEPYKDKE